MENTRSDSQHRDNDRRPHGGGRGGGGGRFRKRVCRLCTDTNFTLDFKNGEQLIRFVSNKGKILPRRLSGSCAKHQRSIAKTIKRSRAAGFLPYSTK
ncbi:MAG: 30S ribosomal protein S18 [Leptospirales bacterium]